MGCLKDMEMVALKDIERMPSGAWGYPDTDLQFLTKQLPQNK